MDKISLCTAILWLHFGVLGVCMRVQKQECPTVYRGHSIDLNCMAVMLVSVKVSVYHKTMKNDSVALQALWDG